MILIETRQEVKVSGQMTARWAVIFAIMVASGFIFWQWTQSLIIACVMWACALVLAVRAWAAIRRRCLCWAEVSEGRFRHMASTGKVHDIDLTQVRGIAYRDAMDVTAPRPVRELMFSPPGATVDLVCWWNQGETKWVPALLAEIDRLGIEISDSDREALARVGGAHTLGWRRFPRL